jgi:ketosteroid isomerase-like protein
MKYTTVVCLTISSMLLCACTQSSVDVEAERTALRAAADAYHEAGEGLDADGFASSYTSNGLILPPNEAGVTGRDGAHEFIASFAEAPGASVSFSNMNVDVAASGDMGYTLTDAVITVDGPDGQPIEDKIRDFHLWKKQDGDWKIAIDIWNSDVPVAGVAATPLSTTIGEDAVKADPQHYAIEFENDRVRVIRIKYGPGEKSVMHTHGPHVAIFLTDNTVRMTLPDDTSAEETGEAGATLWSDAGEHLPENLSDKPFELVLVEVKE